MKERETTLVFKVCKKDESSCVILKQGCDDKQNHHLITRLVLLTVNADTLRYFVAEWLQQTGFVVYCFPRCSAGNIFMEKDYLLSSGPLSSLQLLSFLDYMYRLVINIILCLWLVAELFSCLYRWKDVSVWVVAFDFTTCRHCLVQSSFQHFQLDPWASVWRYPTFVAKDCYVPDPWYLFAYISLIRCCLAHGMIFPGG